MQLVRLLLLSQSVETSRARDFLKRSRAGSRGLRLSHVLLPQGGPAAASPLTPRQREVLLRMAMGLGTREIARALQISVKTVETHRQALTRRLGIHHLPGLVRYTLQTGLLPLSWLLE